MSSPQFRDFKYSHLFKDKSVTKGIADELKCPFLKPCAAAFEANFLRMETFSFLPAYVAFEVRRNQVIACNGVYETLKRPVLWGDFISDSRPNVGGYLREKYAEYQGLSTEVKTTLLQTLGLNYVVEHLNEEQHSSSPTEKPKIGTLGGSVDAVFSGVIMFSWTIFECLATDLWIALINDGPKEWASRVINSGELQKAEPDARAIYELEYDPRKHFGEYLVETGRLSFQKLSSIKTAYRIAFGKESSDLFEDTADGYVKALSSVRNILIHKNGLVDKKFVGEVGRFPELKNYAVKDTIVLDGEITHKLSYAAGTVGCALLRYADKLMAT